MNDLENRLRDALDAAAGTIPDSAVAPGMVEPDRHRPRRALVIAIGAAAAVVTAIAVPYAIQRDEPVPSPAACPGAIAATPDKMPMEQFPSFSSPSPNPQDEVSRKLFTLPVGGPPRVPYTVTNESGAGYLQDGNTRVPLPGGMQTQVLERLDCSWLVVRTKLLAPGHPGDKEVGILSASGRFVPLGRSAGNREGENGPIVGLSVGMSPDGTKVAYTSSSADGRSRLVAVSVASGNEIASVPIGGDAQVLGWNSGGVWLHSGDASPKRPLRVTQWQPGSAPRFVQGTGLLYPYRGTDRMVWTHRQGPTTCARVVTGGATLMEACLRIEWASFVSLSPDGRILLHADKVWRVADGSEIPPPNWWYPSTRSVWEDNTQVLLSLGSNGLVRCNIDTRACERIFTAATDYNLDLIEDGPYKVLGGG